MEVAESLDASLQLLPHIPELLSGIWALGSDPHFIIEAFKTIDLPKGARILELACGKGATAVQLAIEFGYNVKGIDAFSPFIKEARQKAKEYGVHHLCKFHVEDINNAVDSEKNYDSVIYAFNGPVLGSVEETISRLRVCVKPDGYLFYDSCYLFKEDDENEHADDYLLKGEIELAIKSAGDKLIGSFIFPPEEMKTINDFNTKQIRSNVKTLSRKYPEMSESFKEYIHIQEQESFYLNQFTRGALWVLQKQGV